MSLVLAMAGLAVAASARAEDGIFPNRIVFGQTAALDGPSAALGTGMRDGLLAAFVEANRAGGVGGRTLALVSRNDGYEPDRATAMVRELLDRDHVFALIGTVGTPTAVAIQPIADQAGVPFIAAFTGAEFLRQPYKHDVINIRASYFQETEAMVERLTADLGTTRIAAFFQDDAFGRAGLAGVKRALARRHMQLVAEGSYTRNTVDVDDAVQSIAAGKPQAVIMIGTYKPSAAFIQAARAARLDATFVNISFVGADALARQLGAAGAGVVVAEVVPFPADPRLPVVARYQAALRALSPAAKPSYPSLEGYIAGRLVVSALQRVAGEPTRAALLDTVSRTGRFDLDGVSLSYGPDDNRGSDAVYFTVLQGDGTLRPVERLERK